MPDPRSSSQLLSVIAHSSVPNYSSKLKRQNFPRVVKQLRQDRESNLRPLHSKLDAHPSASSSHYAVINRLETGNSLTAVQRNCYELRIYNFIMSELGLWDFKFGKKPLFSNRLFQVPIPTDQRMSQN